MQNTLATYNQVNISKLLVFVASGALVTFCLFVLMDQLTRADSYAPPPTTTIVLPDLVFNEQQQKVIEKRQLPPKPETQIPDTTPIADPQPTDQDNITTVQYAGPKPDISIDKGVMFTIQDASATPVVRMAPDYPVEAARNGVEGWVQLMFAIDAKGQVKDVQVVDAQPKRIFDRAARKALLKWKYKPTIANGKPVEQSGMVVVLDFKLDS